MPETQLNLQQNPEVFSSHQIYDVAIVGAGPVGLATAIGLHKRGIENIIVLDQTKAFRQVGHGVDLLPNGLKALKTIAPEAYEAVKKTGCTFFDPRKSDRQWCYKNFQGETIRSIPLSFEHWLHSYGEGRISIPWYDLQTTLRHLLPEEKVKPNHRCINLVNQPENNSIQLEFVSDLGSEANPYAHWQYQKAQGDNSDNPQAAKSIEDSANLSPQLARKSIQAKLVVGADGINSTIRNCLYQDSDYNAFGKPEYSGLAAIGGREISAVPQEIVEEIELKFLNKPGIVSISNHQRSDDSLYMEYPRMMLLRRDSGEFGYIIHAPLFLDDLKGKSENALIGLILSVLEQAEFPSCLRELVRLSPPENMIQRPYYIHRASLSENLIFPHTASLHQIEAQPLELPWNFGRLVLVGDAAHGMPPLMAQGANQGLEDAAAITEAIAQIAKQNHWQNLDQITATFKKYEQLRRPLMVTIQQATMKGVLWSETERQAYNQQVYCRNFEKILATLFNTACSEIIR